MAESGDSNCDRLQAMLREVDSLISGECAARVKDFIRFTFAEEERRRRQEAEEMKETGGAVR